MSVNGRFFDDCGLRPRKTIQNENNLNPLEFDSEDLIQTPE